MNIAIRAPSVPVLVVSLFLAFFSLIGIFFSVPLVTPWAFWLAFIAYVMLALGTVLKT